MKTKDISTLRAKARQARYPGSLAFILHRISGLAIVLYLFLHVYNIAAYAMKGSAAFNEHLLSFNTPLFEVMEALLIVAVLFHGLNGVRVILLDFGVIKRAQDKAFYVVFAVSAVVGLLVGAAMVGGLI